MAHMLHSKTREQESKVIPQYWKVTTENTYEWEKHENTVLNTKIHFLTNYKEKANKSWGIYHEKYTEKKWKLFQKYTMGCHIRES